MVLTTREGGAARAGRTPGRGAHRPTPAGSAALPRACRGAPGSEAGSQVLEFAMVLPLVGMALALLAQVGLLLGDVLVVQGVAREAARTIAVQGDVDPDDLAGRVAPSRDVRLDVDRGDDVVTVHAELATRAFAPLGVDVWLPARATFHDEAGADG